MIQHILLFRFRASTPDEAIDKIMKKFLECKEKLAGFTRMDFGRNVSAKQELSKEFNYGVIMVFANKESIAVYNALEEHREAQQLQVPYVEEILVFDIHVP